ncbi:MAG: hypothetical protein JRC77_02765 [Deltaproteobacteria bacterium]|nr:hypothetical protein [Deltaproteobacteria bacterium]
MGYIYTSNWPGESTDFDQSLLPRIVEGESTRTDVEALLGRPTGLKVFPIIDNEEDLMISYFYVGKSGFAGMSGSVVKKAEYLVGKDGVVKEISVKIESH